MCRGRTISPVIHKRVWTAAPYASGCASKWSLLDKRFLLGMIHTLDNTIDMKRINHESIAAAAHVSDEEVRAIVEEQMPQWKAACENAGAEAILLTQDAFGHSFEETMLLAIAIRYADMTGKTVTVIPSKLH